MQRPATLGWIVTTTLAVACGGGQKQPTTADTTPVVEPAEADTTPASADTTESLPEIPGSPQPAPASLLAAIEVANPAAVWTALGAYADAVHPGAGGKLTRDVLAHGVSDMLELTRADAIDMDKPFRLLVLDPQAVPEPFVAVVHATDEKALHDAARQGGRAVIGRGGVFAVGSRRALKEGAPYALTTFAGSPAPEAPRLTVYVHRLMERYRQQVQMVAGMARAQLSGMSGPEGELYASLLEGSLGLASQIDLATATLEVDSAAATGTLAITPMAGTGLAGFIAAQRPSSFSLLDVLPNGPLVFAGRLELGPIRDVVDQIFRLSTSMYSGLGDAMSRVWKFYEYVEGELAGTMSLSVANGPRFSFTAVADITKPAEARKALAAYYRDIAKASRKEQKLIYKYRPGGLRYRGVKLDQVTMKPGPKATDRERDMLAVFGGAQVSFSGIEGDRLLAAGGSDAEASARALIDAVKTKQRAIPAWLGAVAADARERKESILMALDGASLGAAVQGGGKAGSAAGPGAAMAMGFDGGEMTWRMTVPAAQVVQLQKFGRAMAGQPPLMMPSP